MIRVKKWLLVFVCLITATEWGTKGFYVEDPDGYIIGFGGRPAAHLVERARPME